ARTSASSLHASVAEPCPPNPGPLQPAGSYAHPFRPAGEALVALFWSSRCLSPGGKALDLSKRLRGGRLSRSIWTRRLDSSRVSTLNETLERLYALIGKGSRLGLERMQAACDLLGNPERAFE